MSCGRVVGCGERSELVPEWFLAMVREVLPLWLADRGLADRGLADSGLADSGLADRAGRSRGGRPEPRLAGCRTTRGSRARAGRVR
jgi:hypothetical protein